jgi:hypothetical protein
MAGRKGARGGARGGKRGGHTGRPPITRGTTKRAQHEVEAENSVHTPVDSVHTPVNNSFTLESVVRDAIADEVNKILQKKTIEKASGKKKVMIERWKFQRLCIQVKRMLKKRIQRVTTMVCL